MCSPPGRKGDRIRRRFVCPAWVRLVVGGSGGGLSNRRARRTVPFGRNETHFPKTAEENGHVTCARIFLEPSPSEFEYGRQLWKAEFWTPIVRAGTWHLEPGIGPPTKEIGEHFLLIARKTFELRRINSYCFLVRYLLQTYRGCPISFNCLPLAPFWPIRAYT